VTALLVTPPPDDEALTIALAMVGQLPEDAQAEIAWALRLQLFPPETPADRRLRLLGPLADLLARLARGELEAGACSGPSEEASEWGDVPRLSRQLYDRLAPPEATPSRRLVDDFGSWYAACRAAHGLLPDGRYLGEGRPWSSGPRVQRRSDREISDAVRECGLLLGRRPSSADYYRFQTIRAARLRERGGSAKHPPAVGTAIARFGSWASVLAACHFTDSELAAARVARILRGFTPEPADDTPPARLAQLTETALGQLGMSPLERDHLMEQGCGELPVERACELARALEGSLDWLAGRTSAPGSPPPAGSRFSKAGYLALRRKSRMKERHVLQHLDWPLGALRRALNGTDPMPLRVAASLADLLQVSLHHLLEAPGKDGPQPAS